MRGAMTARLVPPPSDWVRDYIRAQRNFFPDLDERGEALWRRIGPRAGRGRSAAAARSGWPSITAWRACRCPADADGGRPAPLRSSPQEAICPVGALGAPGRAFALAYQLALFEQAEALDAQVARAGPPDAPARALLRVALANYAAAAAMLPYEPFRKLCEDSWLRPRDGRQSASGLSHEQVCHRLTTLSRPRARGIPFFMLRIDAAGNVSKRFRRRRVPVRAARRRLPALEHPRRLSRRPDAS